MTLIIIFSTIVFFIFGFIVMVNIDKFIDKSVQPTKNYILDKDGLSDDAGQRSILIFGNNKITTVVKNYCKAHNYLFSIIEDINNIDKKYKYLTLFALSNNDADNLIISSVGLKVYSIPHIITICNSQENLRIYNEFNFDKVILYDEDIEKTYNVIKELVDNAIKIQA